MPIADVGKFANVPQPKLHVKELITSFAFREILGLPLSGLSGSISQAYAWLMLCMQNGIALPGNVFFPGLTRDRAMGRRGQYRGEQKQNVSSSTNASKLTAVPKLTAVLQQHVATRSCQQGKRSRWYVLALQQALHAILTMPDSSLGSSSLRMRWEWQLLASKPHDAGRHAGPEFTWHVPRSLKLSILSSAD